MINIQITTKRINYFQFDENRTRDGSELFFNGRVRSKEEGKVIKALEYEQYEGMAETELKLLAEESILKFPISDISCIHRIGKIPVGETSLHAAIWSKHRKEGLEAISYFISELKRRVPIWKWAILEDGRKVPSYCNHD